MRDPFLRALSATIETRRLLRPRDSVLVAVSGGPDSVALLAALAALGRDRWRIGVGHVNHRLRGADSDRDERFVAALATRFGLDLHALDGRIPTGANLEERAREIRYRLLLEAARGGRYRRVATGHTLDDQAETFLLRLLRGAGARGLGAIAPERADGVVRPLIEVRRSEVLAFLGRVGLRFRRDRSNLDPRFTRNRLRRRLLPLLAREFNPAVHRVLARTAAILADDDAVLERAARTRLARLVRADRLDATALAATPIAMSRRIVRLWLQAVRGDLVGTSADHVEAVVALARGAKGGAAALPRGAVRRSGGQLRWLATTATPVRPARAIALTRSGEHVFSGFRFRARLGTSTKRPQPTIWRAVFDVSALPGELTVRAPRPGDRIRPHGLGGTKKLQDVFVDGRIDRERRAGYPVVVHGNTLLWVPGLVRADAALVTANTARILVVECRRSR